MDQAQVLAGTGIKQCLVKWLGFRCSRRACCGSGARQSGSGNELTSWLSPAPLITWVDQHAPSGNTASYASTNCVTQSPSAQCTRSSKRPLRTGKGRGLLTLTQAVPIPLKPHFALTSYAHNVPKSRIYKRPFAITGYANAAS